jgi:saccharopine dehydrogenase-like NADP-dependent oxidoreductase
MSYAPGETDMTIIHVEVEAGFPDGHREKRMATMVKNGEPDGDSAMAKAVGLPPAIAARFIFEGKIKEAGVQLPPSLPYLYKPFVAELEEYGFHFKKHTISL